MASILVVDGGASDRELLAAVLRHDGYTVLEAHTGEEALRLARAHQPDLVIADILMPTMDGYELVRELRGDAVTASIPVIFHTATCVIEEVSELAAACGVSHVLTKPCDPAEVLAVVAEVLSRPPEPVASLPSEDFHREHLRLLNVTLLQKLEELRETVILVGSLQRESETGGENHRWPGLAPDSRLEALSRREMEVLGMIVEGATNSEIAERLVIATSTVQSHVKRILHKLGVKNRTEAAVRYVRK
jgi:DNA-binding NarL/FixJ family response regulator